jgi:hypothetical protein
MLQRQWFKPGRRVEQLGKLAAHPFLSRRRDEFAEPRSRPLLAALAENVGALLSLSLVLIVAIAALVFATRSLFCCACATGTA